MVYDKGKRVPFRPTLVRLRVPVQESRARGGKGRKKKKRKKLLWLQGGLVLKVGENRKRRRHDWSASLSRQLWMEVHYFPLLLLLYPQLHADAYLDGSFSNRSSLFPSLSMSVSCRVMSCRGSLVPKLPRYLR
ncbi:hypothetical protein LY76DRAFT_345536 [Colletotrichum caudatum]|nr:hypothetical protein LY76DRAFT_345536 [Colletotrichum caudatum]